jgi:hypothetical protein
MDLGHTLRMSSCICSEAPRPELDFLIESDCCAGFTFAPCPCFAAGQIVLKVSLSPFFRRTGFVPTMSKGFQRRNWYHPPGFAMFHGAEHLAVDWAPQAFLTSTAPLLLPLTRILLDMSRLLMQVEPREHGTAVRSHHTGEEYEETATSCSSQRHCCS